MPPKKDRTFGLMLTQQQEADLLELSQYLEVTKAEVMRRALRASFRMSIAGVPTCSNLTACRAPHLCIISPAASQSETMTATPTAPSGNDAGSRLPQSHQGNPS